MSFRLNISAGYLFELIRPAAFFASAVLSTLVFASARKREPTVWRALVWALATFVLPLIVLPLYLIRLLFRRQPDAERPEARHRFSLPALYLLAVLSFTSVHLHKDSRGVDAHLARATQARLIGETQTVVREYEQALLLENNAHIRKLLGLALIEKGDWERALRELQSAERDGERDPQIAFRLATAYEQLGLREQAAVQYARFVRSDACLQPMPHDRCAMAQAKLKDLE